MPHTAHPATRATAALLLGTLLALLPVGTANAHSETPGTPSTERTATADTTNLATAAETTGTAGTTQTAEATGTASTTQTAEAMSAAGAHQTARGMDTAGPAQTAGTSGTAGTTQTTRVMGTAGAAQAAKVAGTTNLATAAGATGTAGTTQNAGLPGTAGATRNAWAADNTTSTAQIQGRVALIGVPGLEWRDLDETRTPNLWKLVAQGGSASLSTRAVPAPNRGTICPAAGWLTVSAGQRAGIDGRGCPALPAPQPSGAGAVIPTWGELSAHQADTGFNARLGTLGHLVTSAGGTVAAIGPGAAVAGADRSGIVAKYASTPEALGDLTPYHLIILDAGDLAAAWSRQPLDEQGVPTAMPADVRAAAVAQADRRVGALLDRLPQGTSVLVGGISDVTPNAHLHVAIATGPSPDGRPYPHGHLTATSTRQDSLVTVTDLTATAIRLLGLEQPREVVGRPWQPDGTAPASTAETVAGLADGDLASQILREVRGPFFTVLVSVQLLFYAWAALALRRRRTTPRDGDGRHRADPLQDTDESRPPGSPQDTAGSQQAGPPQDSANPQQADSSHVHASSRQTDSAQETAISREAGSPHGTANSTPAASPSNATSSPLNPVSPQESRTSQEARTSPEASRPHGADPHASHLHASRPRADRFQDPGPDAAGASRLLVAVQSVAVVSGAIAVSTFLAQLVPWWSLPVPMLSVIVTILGIAGLITAVAFAGPWRAHVLGPLTVVSLITSLALLVDVMTGSHLQVNAVTGYEPVTGGRFYGFSNIAFAVYATGTILGLSGVAQWLLEKGVPRIAVVSACALYGAFAVFADGWPAWGADFGGVPAFVIGLAVFLILLSGRRVSIVKLVLVAVVGGVLVGGIAVVDWLRPESQRTHLGAFVQQIIDGQAWTVVSRKFGAMIGVTVGNWPLTLLSVVALAFLFLVLNRPSRWGAPALGQAYVLAPAFRAGLFGALTCAFVGFLINDSGIAIPAMALTVAVPLTLAACVRALQLATPTRPGRSSERAAPTRSEA
ncbi:hypothetical protein [Nonomuraea antri]|uniref:hypothetical protein n=1 Tax=Nonomuraea antri TaxID=2730852 RepID=UPI001569F341|nr:hypothetical protein [Nonomuraea antri]